MTTLDVPFKLNPKVSAPLDARQQGTLSSRPSGNDLYNGLLRYETDTSKFSVYKDSTSGWVDAGTLMGSLPSGTGSTLSNYFLLTGSNTVSAETTFNADIKAQKVKILAGTAGLADGTTRAWNDYGLDECVAKFAINDKITTEVATLAGNAPPMLNTLQKLAEELQNPGTSPANSILDDLTTAHTDIDQIKADPGSQLSLTTMLDHFVDPANSYAETAHNTSDYVQNAIGRVASGQTETIAVLRQRYTKLDHLISAMLNIAPVPENNPTPTGDSISVTGTGSTSVIIGTQISRTWTITVNRGSWSPSASSTQQNGLDGIVDTSLIPYGTVSSMELINPFDSESLGATPPITSLQGQIVSASAPTQTFTPSNLTPLVMSSAIAQTAAGTVVYNNKGNTRQKALRNWSVAGPTYYPYAQVFKGADQNATGLNNGVAVANQGNVASTQTMIHNTAIAYITELTFAEGASASQSVLFPREPMTTAQSTHVINNQWDTAATAGTNWTKTSFTRTVGSTPNVPYWEWKWIGTSWSGGATFKVTF